MSEISLNNKRIAKNTIYMYIRMFFSIIVGLYTSRIVLSVLGVEDFGLYNVIGGIIGMFGFINGSMSNATSRFITYYLGKNVLIKVNEIFNLALLIHFGIAFIILVIGETVGLWYLNNKLVIPDGRMYAAQWLYQLTIASSVIAIISVPYNSSIIAHEKMSAFAYISMMDIVLRLLIVIAISYSPYDKLIFYGTMLFAVQVSDRIVYGIYCSRNFPDTKFRPYWNKKEFNQIFIYAGWNMLGTSSYVIYNQGINLILNFFFGPAVNAARGIALQVENLVKQFANNIQVAINPQIVKSYAQNEMERMFTLIFASSKYCFYLLFLLSFPIILEADYILTLWLGHYPEHTVSFLRITLCSVMMDCFINPLWTANNATGNVRKMQIAISLNSYCFLPILLILLKYTNIAEIAFIVYFISRITSVIIRLYLLHQSISLPVMKYCKLVLNRVIIVALLSMIVPFLTLQIRPSGFWGFIMIVTVCFISTILCIWYFGLCNNEREIALFKVKSIMIKKITNIKL